MANCYIGPSLELNSNGDVLTPEVFQQLCEQVTNEQVGRGFNIMTVPPSFAQDMRYYFETTPNPCFVMSTSDIEGVGVNVRVDEESIRKARSLLIEEKDLCSCDNEEPSLYSIEADKKFSDMWKNVINNQWPQEYMAEFEPLGDLPESYHLTIEHLRRSANIANTFARSITADRSATTSLNSLGYTVIAYDEE